MRRPILPFHRAFVRFRCRRARWISSHAMWGLAARRADGDDDRTWVTTYDLKEEKTTHSSRQLIGRSEYLSPSLPVMRVRVQPNSTHEMSDQRRTKGRDARDPEGRRDPPNLCSLPTSGVWREEAILRGDGLSTALHRLPCGTLMPWLGIGCR